METSDWRLAARVRSPCAIRQTSESNGGPEGSRTPDLVNAIHARSQLRHWPITFIVRVAAAVINNSAKPAVRSTRWLLAEHALVVGGCVNVDERTIDRHRHVDQRDHDSADTWPVDRP